MLTFYFSGAEGWMTEPEILTAGMVGKQVKFEFSEEWDTMIKTAVFSDGVVIRDVALNGDTAVIPAEVLAHPLRPFFLGIYGVSEDGTLVIPTIRVLGPTILPGADPSGDPGIEPDLPLWAQLQSLIGDLAALDTATRENLVRAINELVHSKADKSDASVYAYAVRGGYTGTEAELMEKLAADFVRTVNGRAPDDSGNILLSEHNVQFVEQALTEEQQASARANIGAGSSTDVEAALSTANTAKTNSNSAMSRANLAYSNAAKATTTANTAQTTADKSLELAQNLAASKLDAAGIASQMVTVVTATGETITLNVLVKS